VTFPEGQERIYGEILWFSIWGLGKHRRPNEYKF